MEALVMTNKRIECLEMLLTWRTVISGEALQMLGLDVADNIAPID